MIKRIGLLFAGFLRPCAFIVSKEIPPAKGKHVAESNAAKIREEMKIID